MSEHVLFPLQAQIFLNGSISNLASHSNMPAVRKDRKFSISSGFHTAVAVWPDTEAHSSLLHFHFYLKDKNKTFQSKNGGSCCLTHVIRRIRPSGKTWDESGMQRREEMMQYLKVMKR